MIWSLPSFWYDAACGRLAAVRQKFLETSLRSESGTFLIVTLYQIISDSTWKENESHFQKCYRLSVPHGVSYFLGRRTSE